MKVTLKISKPSNKTWTVKGADIAALFKNLQAHDWWGRYRSNNSGKFAGKSSQIDTVTLTAKPVITMPKWATYSKASKGEKKSWDAMFKALRKHEDEHHTIFVKSAEDWKTRMECGDDLSKKDMDKAWKLYQKDSQKDQDDFDKRTGHGTKAGVVLNIP
jgi:predicted secreted Zn-dependent protease